jgi:hypothetical protein
MNCSAEYQATHPVTVGALYNSGFYYEGVCLAYNEVLQVGVRTVTQ